MEQLVSIQVFTTINIRNYCGLYDIIVEDVGTQKDRKSNNLGLYK